MKKIIDKKYIGIFIIVIIAISALFIIGYYVSQKNDAMKLLRFCAYNKSDPACIPISQNGTLSEIKENLMNSFLHCESESDCVFVECDKVTHVFIDINKKYVSIWNASFNTTEISSDAISCRGHQIRCSGNICSNDVILFIN